MKLIADYFAAFNAGDVAGMLDCLADDVAHHVNEGQVRRGRQAFAEFCDHMARCYREDLTDLVIFEARGGGVHRQRDLPAHRRRIAGGAGPELPPAGGVVL